MKVDKKKLSFTLKGGHIKIKMEGEELQKYLQERKRGCGWHGSKKDYKRKEKHHKKLY